MSDFERGMGSSSGEIVELGALPLPAGAEGSAAAGGSSDFSPEARSQLKALWPEALAWRAVSAVWGTPGVRVLAVAHAGSPRAGALALREIAFSLAASEHDVLLVDLDLDHPTFPKPFQYQPDEGIADMALFGTSPGAALRKTHHDQIRVVTVGSPPIESSEVYASKELEEIVAGFRAEWDAVLISMPLFVEKGAVCPALRVADVVLVVAPAALPAPDAAKALAALSPAPRILGMLRVRTEPAQVPVTPPAPPPPSAQPAPPAPAAPPAREAPPRAPAKKEPGAAPPKLGAPSPGTPSAPTKKAPASSESPPSAPPSRPAPPPAASAPPPPAGAPAVPPPLSPAAPTPVPRQATGKPVPTPAAAPTAPPTPPTPPSASPRAPGPPPARAPLPPPRSRTGGEPAPTRAARALPARRGPAWILLLLLLAAAGALGIGYLLARAGRARVAPGNLAARGSAPATTGAADSARRAGGATTSPSDTATARSGAAPVEEPAGRDTLRLTTPWGGPSTATLSGPRTTGTPAASQAPGTDRQDSARVVAKGGDAGAGAPSAPSTTQPATPPPAPSTGTAGSARPSGRAYGIQVSSHPSHAPAETDSFAWARKGFSVAIVAKDLPEKGGVWYRVVLGRYSGRAEAQAAADSLRRAGRLDDAAVVSLPAR